MNLPTIQSTFNSSLIRADFPVLDQEVNGHPLIYLDNAATTQKPHAVIEAMQRFYLHENANIHRGVHALSQRATEQFEGARSKIARFIGADAREVIFVRGATEGVNLVANSFVRPHLKAGDVIVLTAMEHHANIVPWQILAKSVGARIEVVPVLPDGTLDRAEFSRLVSGKSVALLGLVYVSNALGTINPAADLIAEAHAHGVPVLLDAAQAVPHFDVNVRELDCDFMVFSGHKLFGPTGIGVVYGKYQLLLEMLPYQGGGDMIEQVSFAGTTFKAPPERFEAGTPHIAGVIGLAAAIEYLGSVDRLAAHQYELELLHQAEAGLRSIPGLRIVGEAPVKTGVASFVIENIHPHDIGTFLDVEGIAIRTGHHCAQPLMEHLGLTGTARASFAFYNTPAEVDALVRAVSKIARFFG